MHGWRSDLALHKFCYTVLRFRCSIILKFECFKNAWLVYRPSFALNALVLLFNIYSVALGVMLPCLHWMNVFLLGLW